MASRTSSRHRAVPMPAGRKSAAKQFALALEHQLAGRVKEAEFAYRQSLAIDPSFAEACNNLGVLVRGRDATEAHALFEQAVALRPGYADALVNLGRSYRERGDVAGAIACFRRALQVDPDRGVALNDLSAALRTQGALAEALTIGQ